MFTVPFFFIIGFDTAGDVGIKFLWYWLIDFLFLASLIYFGQTLGSIMPSNETASGFAGLASSFVSSFCGFVMPYQSFPKFWRFMYWLSPLHYTLEALVVTQFHHDDTAVSLADGSITTAESYVGTVFTAWKYKNLSYDIVALIAFSLFCWYVVFYSLLPHENHHVSQVW